MIFVKSKITPEEQRKSDLEATVKHYHHMYKAADRSLARAYRRLHKLERALKVLGVKL